MKLKFFLFAAFVLFATAVFAQAPGRMSYQSVVRDGNGALVANNPVGIRISVIQGSVFGASVYVETHTATTNANGLASLAIGGGTAVFGNFGAIDWANGPYFIKTETDPSGGSNYNIVGSSELLSVPYALFAANGGTPGPQGPEGPSTGAASGDLSGNYPNPSIANTATAGANIVNAINTSSASINAARLQSTVTTQE